MRIVSYAMFMNGHVCNTGGSTHGVADDLDSMLAVSYESAHKKPVIGEYFTYGVSGGFYSFLTADCGRGISGRSYVPIW